MGLNFFGLCAKELLRRNVRVILRALPTPTYARVVKLVDTGDLKSPDRLGRAGSSPAPGTI